MFQRLITESAKHRATLLQLEVQKARGQTMSRSEVDRMLLTLAMRQRTILFSAMEMTLPPRLDGLTAAEARPILREAADEITDAMRDCLNGFQIDYDANVGVGEVAP